MSEFIIDLTVIHSYPCNDVDASQRLMSLTLSVLHYYLTFSFHLKLALLTQLPTSNERKIPPHLKIKLAKFHNGGFIQDLYMPICSISVKF